MSKPQNKISDKYIYERYYSGIKSKKRFLYKLQFWNDLRFARHFASITKKGIDKMLKASGAEARETKKMAQLFFRLLESKLDLKNRKEPPSAEEVKEAIEQLKDVGRISVFATISIIPGGGFSLIGLELLARRFGVKGFTFVPSSFRKERQ